jgi:hypothetical protein
MPEMTGIELTLLSSQVSKTSIRSPSFGEPAYFGHSSVSGMAMR